MNASKLFHTIVVLGMSLGAESACSSDTPPTPSPVADAGSSSGSSGTSSSGSTSGAVADASTSGKDAFAGWFCCG